MQCAQTAIDSFREAAVEPDQWPRALETLARSLRSDAATLVFKQGRERSIVCSTGVAHHMPEYMHLPIQDPREQRARASTREGFLPDYAHFTAREIASDPYYQEFLVPRGLGRHAVAALHDDLLISVKRSVRLGHYDGADLDAINDVLPWLRAASRTASMVWRSHFSGQLLAFERIGRGALLLDAHGHVLQINACVHFGDGLDVSGGALQVPRATDRQRLQCFLAALIDAGAAHRLPEATTLCLPRPSGRRPWLIDGIGCPKALHSLHSDAAALLLVTDLDRPRPPLRPNKLVELFGLTPREAELASELASGASLQCAAVRLSISEEHARQRLKAVFQKTRTGRQGELVALLSPLR